MAESLRQALASQLSPRFYQLEPLVWFALQDGSTQNFSLLAPWVFNGIDGQAWLEHAPEDLQRALQKFKDPANPTFQLEKGPEQSALRWLALGGSEKIPESINGLFNAQMLSLKPQTAERVLDGLIQKNAVNLQWPSPHFIGPIAKHIVREKTAEAALAWHRSLPPTIGEEACFLFLNTWSNLTA